MKNKPIEFRNFEPHEKQRAYMVFYFYARDHADYFESLLIEHNIPYERGAGKDLVRRHLIGIHRQYLPEAEKLNNDTGNFFRKPFLADKGLRYFILLISLLGITLAIIGWIVHSLK